MTALRCAFCGNVDDDVEAPTNPGDEPAHSWLNHAASGQNDSCPPIPANYAACSGCTRAFLLHELAKDDGDYLCRSCWRSVVRKPAEFARNRRKDCLCDTCAGIDSAGRPMRVLGSRRAPQADVARKPDLALPEDWTNVATICEMWGLNPKDVNENKKARRALAKYAENGAAEVEDRDNPDGGHKTKWYRRALA
jgi:hypothetical protein